MSEDRIDATDKQIAQAFEDLRQRLRVLPLEFDFLNDKFSQAVDRLTDPNSDLPELEELTAYRSDICNDLRAAMRWGLEFDAELPACAKLANSLEAFGDDGPNYKTFILAAQVELDRVRAMFERAAERDKDPAEFLTTNELRHRFASDRGEPISKRQLQDIALPQLADSEKRQVGKKGTWMLSIEAVKRVMASTAWKYREAD